MVQIKSNVTKPDCLSFDYNQTTGAYSVSNTTGWGAPNKELADVATSILVIKNNKTGVIYDDIAVIAATTATDNYIFANLFLSATPTGIETIQDGIYSFTHTVTLTDDSTIETIAYIASLCELNCSIQSFVDTMLDTKDACCTSDKSDRMKAFSELMALYDILTKSFLCNNFEAFNSIYSSIELLLTTLNNCA
jgi:hypothetical protein